MLSIQVPLYRLLLTGLCSFLCVLVRFADSRGYKLYSAIRGAKIRFSAWAQHVKFFVPCLKPTCTLCFLTKESHWLSSKTIGSGCPPLSSKVTKVALLLLWVVSSHFGQMGWINNLHRGWAYVSVSLPRQEEERPLQVSFNFTNRLFSLERSWTTISLGYEFIPLPVHSMGMPHA